MKSQPAQPFPPAPHPVPRRVSSRPAAANDAAPKAAAELTSVDEWIILRWLDELQQAHRSLPPRPR